jgi:hypothetical protein
MAPEAVLVCECLAACHADMASDIVMPVNVCDIAQALQELFATRFADVLATNLMDCNDVIGQTKLLAK